MKGEKRVYATIDTNVLVSSFFSATGLSNPARIIRSVFDGVITPLYNEDIIDEYRAVLSRDKFKFAPVHIENLISAFTSFGINTNRASSEGESFPDSDDVVFYEVTMSIENAYLVTGNTKHFPQKPFVVTPAQMVDILRRKGLLD